MDDFKRYERLKRCPFCAEEILVAAIKCKHCQADLATTHAPRAPSPPPPPAPPLSIWKRPVSNPILGILCSAVVLAWLAGAFDSPKSTYVSETSAPVAPIAVANSATPNKVAPIVTAPNPAKKERGLYKTTAVKLYREYTANEVATDQRIGDAMIEVSGVIKSIDKNVFDDPEIKLDVGDDFNAVGLDLDKSQLAEAGRLSKGQSVTIRCDKMKRIVDYPIGSDCKFVD